MFGLPAVLKSVDTEPGFISWFLCSEPFIGMDEIVPLPFFAAPGGLRVILNPLRRL
jgi:hypothetical protein